MNRLKWMFYAIVLTSIGISCNMECFTPPGEVVLELIDQDSTLLVQRDDFEATSLRAYKLATSVGNTPQKSLPIRIQDNGKLTIDGVGWEEGKITYVIEIKRPIEKQFEMHVTASEVKAKGCGGMRLEEVYFTGVTATKKGDYYSIAIVP